MKLSIVIPCYNEAENIPVILNRFQKYLTQESIEVILVNNGSMDNSAEILTKLLPVYPFVRTVTVEVNQGYGYGILQGLRAADGDFVGWTHADMQTDPGDIFIAYHILEKNNWDNNIFVKGLRKKRNYFDQFFTSGMSFFETIYLNKKLYDINAQPNIFSKYFFDMWETPPSDFALDLYVLYMAQINNLQIIRFDVLFPQRMYGKSHWNTGLSSKLKFIKRTVDFSRSLKRVGIK